MSESLKAFGPNELEQQPKRAGEGREVGNTKIDKALTWQELCMSTI